MKITEILNEDVPVASGEKLSRDQFAGMKGGVSLPALSMNKSNGSFYQQYRFGIALAGAPEHPTPASGAFSGDPFALTYTDAEKDMIDYALVQVGLKSDGGGDPPSKRELTDNESSESPSVNRSSVTRSVGPISLIKKTKK